MKIYDTCIVAKKHRKLPYSMDTKMKLQFVLAFKSYMIN